MNKLVKWIDDRFPLISTWKAYWSDYYVPKNLNIYYCFGALALLVLFNQVLTGLWLTMFYTPTTQEAFHSIEYIMRDVHFGWLLRYLHTTGASAFLLYCTCIYFVVCCMVLIKNHVNWFGCWAWRCLCS